MLIDNKYFLLHTEAELILKRCAVSLLTSPASVALGIDLRESSRTPVPGHIYFHGAGHSYAMDESGAGGLCFDFSTIKDDGTVVRFDSMLGEFASVVVEGEILSGPNSTITVMKVIRKKKSRKQGETSFIFGSIDIQYFVQSKEAA